MKRYYYSDSIQHFLERPNDEILGIISRNNEFPTELTQKQAWIKQIEILKESLSPFAGKVYFEFSIPRMGRRIDVVAIIDNVIFIIEFKVGEKEYASHAVDQVWDYALDLKNFHETSNAALIAPILVSTEAEENFTEIVLTPHSDNLLYPIRTNGITLQDIIKSVLILGEGEHISHQKWEDGRYSPTPTIIEAAMALFNKHSVTDISRSDASAVNLRHTSSKINNIIQEAKDKTKKAICFVTGVPGAGKTLVGLDVATKNLDSENKSTSVFLSGNGPLVAILREALTRDKVKREKRKGKKLKKGDALREVKLFIQNVHHYRDEYLADTERAPIDHVAIFDEAQRAWNKEQTHNFMSRKKNVPNFSRSEPEFLISCLDRHKDWAVIVCLVGGGQEINTGEAGISEWLESIVRSFPHWQVYISENLHDSEYAAGKALNILSSHQNVIEEKKLHLSVSMRSFRAEHLAQFVKNTLDLDIASARKSYLAIKHKYPLVITRDVQAAKQWLKSKARGTERFGIIVSSQAQRLKPYAIDVRTPVDPVHWFLDGKDDVRSSYYLEDVATEFQVQGLELDWSCVTWDGDFRYSATGWQSHSFVGSSWRRINKTERKLYLKNAYRVLLTRARQGMVIVVPQGDISDPTRLPEFYDNTFNYLKEIGIESI